MASKSQDAGVQFGQMQALWEDGERVFYRASRDEPGGGRRTVIVVVLATENPTTVGLDRLAHEYSLKDHLDAPWAVRSLDLVRERGRTMLVLEDAGAEPLHRLLGSPMELPTFLRLAEALTAALRGLHERGLIHKDINPANVLVNDSTSQVWLTGFGLASRLPRELQAPSPPEFIAGTLPYMAPEQTGRMNRSIDSRTDLYSLGITFYQMLTGALPFTASDPMEWVHCHIARTPLPPHERVANIPALISQIVVKLLAKTAEERYQTAAGVEHDLRQCRTEWEMRGGIDQFRLAAHDAPARLLIPEKLYGRPREVAALLSSFHRVIATGTPELVLVSGYSGIGKSSVVNELHKVLVPPQGFFASGKFDQYKRDIPYATVAQAFQSLIRQILSKSEAELQTWRDTLREALGPNGLLIVGLIPELELIIGKQPPIPDLSPQDAQRRFQTVLRRFIAVFARPEHPLVLFLDDLQWLDAATLDLLEDLLAQRDIRHLLLIGAYRDNEVGAAHPLMRKLDAIRQAGAAVHDIVLAALTYDDLEQLISDSLRCETKPINQVVQLVHEKTGGNPFFAIQFLHALADEALLVFDHADRRWLCDLGRVRTKNYSGNVVDLMAAKLRRLSAPAQEVLKQFACLGNAAETSALVLALGETEESMHTAFAEAVHAGLVVHQERAYKFLHDRIQQAAYSLIPDAHRADVHLRIGRVLLASMTADQLAEHLFDVANQLNQGAARLIDRDEKAQVATINLRAGRKAKASAAYASTLAYFSAGVALLDENDWSSQYELTFNLWLERAECEFLTGALDTAGQLIEQLLQRAASKVDEAAVYDLKVRLHILKSEPHDAVATALTCLRRLGIEMPAHPTQEQVQAEYETVWQILDGRSIESLIDLPVMTDPVLRAAMQVLSEVAGPAYFIDTRLFCLVMCRMVKVSLQHGLSGPSAYGFASWGVLLSGAFHRYGDGYRFAKLACDLVAKHGFIAGHAKVYCSAVLVAGWVQPIAVAIDFARKGARAAVETGDTVFACYSGFVHTALLLTRNDPLDAVWREAETSLDFARRAKYADVADIIVSQQRFIATMQGRTATFSTFGDAQFDEAAFEAQITGSQSFLTIGWYWIVKLKARFLSGNYAEALAAAVNAKPVLENSAGQIQQLDYFYYTALTVSALYEAAGTDQQQAWRELLTGHREQLREWAENYPPTFADKHALVLAEIARLEGRDADAMRLYEQAIRSAREHGFVQNEGVAYEVAARFYAARGVESIADAYIGNARDCYLRWGADGKVRQLDGLYPHLAGPEGRHSAAAIGAAVQQLDVASVAKASQALSSEIVLPKLIERLMTIAIENAGADRGLLILPAGDEYLIQAEARTTGDQIEVTMRQEPITGINSPESLVRYVIRTRECVILDDASKSNLFSADDYLRDQQSKSILCLPLIKRQQLTGILYLENGLTSHAFTPARIAILELLAAQAAISLENTRLYSDLQEREAKVRRLVDSNIVGICIFDFDGRILEANDAFLDIVRYSRDDLISGRLRWTALATTEWGGAVERALAELASTGTSRPFEMEYSRKDDSRVPVLVGAATFGEIRHQGVAFVVNLTDRKQAEAAARESERRYHEVQMELAHVNRVATIGQLSASIAHEVNQPLSGIVTNASTFARMLAADPPNIAGALETARRTIRDANRAADIIARLRTLFARKETSNELVNLNEASNEIISLSQREFQSSGVTVRAEFADNLAPVKGDKVQLQQVLLNLIRNGMDAMGTVDARPRQLIVTTSRAEPDAVLIAVQDSGPGVDPENLERIFDAFYTTKPNGLGMGLSICRTIIEAHGGKLWATTAAPQGTILQFTLPAAAM
jgi:PAS domain S-box-containing protein